MKQASFKKETIDVIRQMVADGQISQEVAEKYFHGLKESEGERIRKEILDYIINGSESCYDVQQYGKEKFEKWIAWIEKQGEQNLANFAKTCKDEKEPTDKVEPKFHEGEWAAINPELRFASPIRINDIHNNNYRVESVDGNSGEPTIDYIDRNYHLWTIQDAKDGDVLVIQNTNVTYESIFIFNKIENNRIIQYLHYFTTDTGEEVCEARSICGFIGFVGTTVHPATKEQRDLLFQKMKEAGYEWDAEKKELKKIEHTTAWSEGDERNIKELLCLVEANYLSSEEPHDRLINFLESLRPQSQWKPSKEQMEALKDTLNDAIWQYDFKGSLIKEEVTRKHAETIESLYNDLKKLREK